MKFYSFKSNLILAVVFTVLSGCQPPGQTTASGGAVKIQGTNPGSAGGGSMQGGTDNAGGGNAIENQTLDSFIQPLAQHEAYQKIVLPIINELSVKYPRLAADFYHIATNRDWYFLPIELQEISRNILGTYATTDQVALQDLNKLWINSKIFNQMELRQQGILIVHEIIMGIRLMKYKDRQDRCIAKAGLFMISSNSEEVKENQYKEEKKFCRKTYPIVYGIQDTGFKLNKDDYDLIRKLVAKIIAQTIS